MPRTGRRSPAGLTIEVDDFQATYLPGDTLTGCVIYSKPVVNPQPWPQTTIRLKLFGRAKSKYIVKTSNGTSISRGRAVFFDISQNLSLGPETKASGEHAWQFTITIPTTSQPGFAQRGDEWKHMDGYLTTKDAEKKPIDVTQHPLPSIMYYFGESAMSGKTSEAYVEYVLQAEVGQSKATLPLFLRNNGTPAPITNHKPQARSALQLVRSPRLLAEHADKKLTFKQKSSRLFRPSKTPRYTYHVRVEYPTIIQLEHPDPIPLRIAVAPDLDPEKTSICRDGDLQNLPPVNITAIKLQLKMQIDIRCPGTFWDAENDKYHDFDIPFRATLKPFPLPVISASDLKHVMSAPDPYSQYLSPQLRSAYSTPNLQTIASHATATPVTSDTVSTNALSQHLTPFPSITPGLSAPTPLNLGDRYSIFLGCSASSTLGHPPISFKRQVYPTFTTYNIRLKYSLRWRVSLECAGEAQEVAGVAPVTIIAPSEEQEAKKKRELGTEGMKKNYDDLEAGVGAGVQFIGQVLQAVAG